MWEVTGEQGEIHVNNHLLLMKARGAIKDFSWESQENAVAPYDFEIVTMDDTKIPMDVKSTTGSFGTTIHASYNELLAMAEVDRYDLYRVYEVSELTAKLRIAENVGEVARQILEVVKSLPEGITPDSFSVSPSKFRFGREIRLRA